jgi:hypothetical protein
VHDPSAGAAIHDRLTVTSMPEEAPAEAVGGLSQSQQVEQLAHLSALAAPPAAPEVPATAAPRDEPVDRLAAWLIGHADLTDLP